MSTADSETETSGGPASMPEKQASAHSPGNSASTDLPATPVSNNPSDLAAAPNSDSGIWSDYRTQQSQVPIFDEAIDGTIKPHWQRFSQQLDVIGKTELNRRWSNAQRVLADNGVIYNVHAHDTRNQSEQTSQRAWKLDPIPMVVPPQEWQVIEAALKQRVKLLNMVLDDLYGPQTLIKEGLIPAQLLWANSSFLRPAHNLNVAGGRRIVIYAADLGRSHDGKWWFVSDRTQAPSGLGYALENRLIVSRSLPNAFRDCNVQRLAELFRGLQDQLKAIAPKGREEPTIVVLTPGPYAETYFEHAYLARYLGFPLVEGRDLTVRDNRVYLKTLAGLKQVDVIWRRVDDDYCDPLELRGDSALGVTGLMQVVRKGNVALANHIGTGVVEAAGMMPFLPGICRHFLGEDEILPSVATWWCGHDKEREYVLSRLDELIIKPAMRCHTIRLKGPVFGGELSKAARRQLVEDINQQPHAFVGQEVIPLSTTPVWTDDRLSPRRIMMRVYSVATSKSHPVNSGEQTQADGDSGVTGTGDQKTLILPGALTRVASTLDSRVVSMQLGGGSKDTWVLTEGEVSQVSLLPQSSKEIELLRGGPDIPSRLAEDLYWLGRYIERTHGLSRLLRHTLSLIYDEEDGRSINKFVTAIRMVLHATNDMSDSRQLIEAAICDWSGGRGMLGNARNARVLGAAVREVMSSDAWRVIVGLERDCLQLVRYEKDLGKRVEILDGMMTTFAAFSGMGDSMTRGHGYWFLELGRRIERASFICDLCLPLLTKDAAQQDLISLLQIADSIMTYRSRYRSLMSAAAVCDLLILDETNPRSLAFQLAEIGKFVDQLPTHESSVVGLQEEQKIILTMLSPIRLANAHDLCSGEMVKLNELMSQVVEELPELSDALSRHYFSHTQPDHQLTEIQNDTIVWDDLGFASDDNQQMDGSAISGGGTL